MKIIVLLQDDGDDKRCKVNLVAEKGFDPSAHLVAIGLQEMHDSIMNVAVNDSCTELAKHVIRKPSPEQCIRYIERVKVSALKGLVAVAPEPGIRRG